MAVSSWRKEAKRNINDIYSYCLIVAHIPFIERRSLWIWRMHHWHMLRVWQLHSLKFVWDFDLSMIWKLSLEMIFYGWGWGMVSLSPLMLSLFVLLSKHDDGSDACKTVNINFIDLFHHLLCGAKSIIGKSFRVLFIPSPLECKLVAPMPPYGRAKERRLHRWIMLINLVHAFPLCFEIRCTLHSHLSSGFVDFLFHWLSVVGACGSRVL